jgi:hypothetical protein
MMRLSPGKVLKMTMIAHLGTIMLAAWDIALGRKHPPAPSDHAVLVVKFRIEARLSALSTREA